jgi:peptide/nickel transport system permease protein
MEREMMFEQTLVPPAPEPAGEPIARSNWRLFWRRFRRHKPAVLSAIILVLLIIACFAAKWIAPYPRNHQNLLASATGPTAKHLLGTDDLGRDELTEILYAGQVSLKIGLVVALLSTVFGVLVGTFAGFYGRFVDQGLSRLTDLFLVVPDLAVLGVALAAFGHSPAVIILVLAALEWTYIARVLRGEVLAIKEKEYVEAARATGASDRRIIFRHILPNCVGSIMVNLTLAVAGAIVLESTLSFLGLGVQPPDSSWGSLLSQFESDAGEPHRLYLVIGPLIFVLLVVMCVNFLGDGLRDAFDARART